MKKSMIATAVVATAFAASANAGWFDVTGASYSTGSPQSIAGSGFTSGVGTMTNGGDLLAAGQGGSASNVTALSATSLTNITNALTAAYTTGTSAQLTYFSFQDSSTPALGYFGMAFWSGNGSFTFNTSWNDAAIYGSKGVLVSATGFNESAGVTIPDTFTANGTFAANTLYIAVFGGIAGGDGFDGQFNRGSAETRTFDINYLSFGSTAYASIGSGTGARNSSLSVATYVVPVPAPALLAGAGLIGAAAIRRRMAKKA